LKAIWVVALFLVLLFPSVARALDGTRLPTQHMHDAWNENDGLPQNSVKSIVQTPNDGFLWLATEEGLVRFDGTTFRTFDKTSTTGRTTNVVQALAVDNYGRLVILAGKDGVCTFDEPKFSCTALGGDMNAGPKSPVCRSLTCRLVDAQTRAPNFKPRATFISTMPVRRLDHIFVSEHFTIRSVMQPRTPTAAVASDHLPVCAELTLNT
jgi:hypothetical protein